MLHILLLPLSERYGYFDFRMVGSDAIADKTVRDGERFVHVYFGIGEVFEDSLGSVETGWSGTDYCGVTCSSRSGGFDGEGESCIDFGSRSFWRGKAVKLRWG
jgi:hypothetical protein